MSLHPTPIPPVPEETARVARAAFPNGNRYLRLRDELGVFYEDTAFAALFSQRGRPALAPWRLALVLVLQYAEGLADRQAANAVRSRIDWKYALALELTDPGFDASVLSEFRSRLVAGDAELLLLEAMLARFTTAGLLTARGRQRTDSTAVVAAIRTLNRLELVGETLRNTLNHLAQVAPDWLRPRLDPAWAERYGARVDDFRLPKSQSQRDELAHQMGVDGFRLLDALFAAGTPAELRTVSAVETLRQVWLQQYTRADATVHWRRSGNLPPSAVAINSPYDVEARYSTKRRREWIGYTVHVTETCEPDAPHLITDVQTTPATTPDQTQVATIQAALARRDLLPQTHLVDAGYPDSNNLVTSRETHNVQVIGPVPSDPSWQAQTPGGFSARQFQIDWAAQTAVCPAGHASQRWTPGADNHGTPVVTIAFPRSACRDCSLRAHCTTANHAGRQLTIRTEAAYHALQAARDAQETPAFREHYAARAGVEGTIAQAVRVCHLRQARYVGLAKLKLQHILSAAALNVVRVTSWLEDPTMATTRHSPFLHLLPDVA